jgi:AraC family transcriptional regulator, regulatory protein of adaptative response / methylphosphotriester-DNA alkyltransferase methyltransferase
MAIAVHPRRPFDAHRDATVERRRQIFHEAVELLEREYGDGVTLDFAARELATSRRQLQRVLAEVGGTSFRQLLTEVRMRRARAALANGEGSVREVARSVGYDQAADFTKAFRRYHGVPPSRFRNAAPLG